MTGAKSSPSSFFSRRTLKGNVVAGIVLGVESVPDGLARGPLAGINPVVDQMFLTGVADTVVSDIIYPGDEWLGTTMERTHDAADASVGESGKMRA